MTVSEVEGFGQQPGKKKIYRGAKFVTSFINKAKIELIVADDQAEEIVDAIGEAACTGEIGDGKIWISSIDDIIRVRTGERGERLFKPPKHQRPRPPQKSGDLGLYAAVRRTGILAF